MVLISKLIKLHQVNIPKNDIEAFKLYPQYNFIYNRFFIAQLQGLEAFPFPIQPSKFPIVMKPYINLKGMGLNSLKINNIDEFDKHKYSSHFWTQYLDGDHYSIDLIINHGKIIYYVIFEGIKGKTFGTFEYWEEKHFKLEDNKILFKNINLLLNKLPNYTGCLNVESIGNYLIEAHLRLGDIDMKQQDILELIIYNYLDNKKKIYSLLKKINKRNYRKIYLIPVWDKILDYEDMWNLYQIIEDELEPIVIKNNDIKAYYFDSPYHATPIDNKRWFLLIVNNFKKGIQFRNYLKKKIDKLKVKINII